MAKLARCLNAKLGQVHQKVGDWMLPVPPQDPGWGRRNERINIARIRELANRAQAQNPQVALELTRSPGCDSRTCSPAEPPPPGPGAVHSS